MGRSSRRQGARRRRVGRTAAVRRAKGSHPVVNVSYGDAVAYCKWLTGKDGRRATYRLPTAEEWEIAVGHMPKDADFNCGENSGTTPVTQYARTLAACGAVDMWEGQCLGMDEHRDDGADGRGEGKEGSGREGRLLELEAHQLPHGGA